MRRERCWITSRLKKMGPSSARNLGFLKRPSSTFKIPSNPQALAMTTQGVEKRWGFFGPISPRRPSKTRNGTKGILYGLSAASIAGSRAPGMA